MTAKYKDKSYKQLKKLLMDLKTSNRNVEEIKWISCTLRSQLKCTKTSSKLEVENNLEIVGAEGRGLGQDEGVGSDTEVIGIGDRWGGEKLMKDMGMIGGDRPEIMLFLTSTESNCVHEHCDGY